MDFGIIILSTLLITAFFAGIEIAYLSSNKFRIELDNKQGVITARILSFFIKSPSRFIITILVGINFALVIYGKYMAEWLEPFFKELLPEKYATEISIIFLQTFVSSIIILVAGEFIPKVLFRVNPNQTLNLFAVPLLLAYFLLFPVVWIILKITHFILRTVLKTDFVEDKPAFGRLDLDQYVNEINRKAESKNDFDNEIQMFQNALDFDKLKVRECMVPRTEIVAINIDESIESLKKKFIDTGLSKIMVYRDNFDNIIGFVHQFEIFKNPQSIQSILLPIAVVPETMHARELLTLFTQQRKSVALIVDEHGLTSGIVTVEDIMEEIFGEIDDEHDTEERAEQKLSENEYLFAGRLEIDYLNQNYNLDLPYGNYETLGGLIFDHHQRIPKQGEQVTVQPYTLIIQSMKGNRIDQVKLIDGRNKSA